MQELAAIIEEASSALVFLDEDSSPAEWKELRDKIEQAGKLAEKDSYHSVSDAAELALDILDRLSSGELHNPALAQEKLSSMLNVMSASMADIQASGEPTRSFKGEISEARVYLQDMDSAQAEPELPENMVDEDEEAEFLQEMQARVDNVESILLSLAEGDPSGEHIQTIFREYHTLKGEAGILGYTEAHKYYHKVESALDPLRKRAALITAGFVAAMLKCCDLAREHLKKNEVPDSKMNEAVAILQEEVEDMPEGDAPQEEEPEDTDAFFAVMAEDDAAEKVVADMDSPALLEVEDDHEESSATEEQEGEPAPTPVTEPESKPESGPVPAVAPEPEKTAAPKEEQIEEIPVSENEIMNVVSLDVRRIDDLLETVSTVASAFSGLMQNPVLNNFRKAANADLTSVERTVSLLQEKAIGLRMVPVKPLFQRMRRVAFDVARLSVKKVDVKLEGEDTEVDRTVIEKLTGALTHLVRNAIDHGLESSADRRKSSKPERGRMTLKATRSGGDIVIELSDDGRGLDLDQIRASAIKKGLIKEGEDVPNDRLKNIIFEPGFSTADRLTGISGRGVGMDAVRSAVDSLRGRITMDSTPGRGTTVRITLPLSLASIDGLVVRIGEGFFIVHTHAVRECFRADSKEINTVKGKGKTVNLRDTVLPIINIADVLKLPGETKSIEDGVLVVVESRGRLASIMVDEVLNTQQVMVRPLSGGLEDLDYVTGTAALGSGRLALVLDTGKFVSETSASAGELGSSRKDSDRIEIVDVGSNQVGMVDFNLDHLENGKSVRCRYAINAFKAREFVPCPELTPLPSAPPGFAGMLMLRNRTIPVVNLAGLIGFEAPEDSQQIVIICEFGSHTIGLTVSAVNRVNYISWRDILPPPNSGQAAAQNYIVGTILMGKEVVFVLDFEHIVQKVLSIYNEFGDSLDGVEKRKSGSRVLLVEDSAIVRKKTARALEAAGLEVIQKNNGQEGDDEMQGIAQKIRENGGNVFDYYDVVVSDIEMPQLDGYTFTRNIKTTTELMGIPVILFSSLTNETIVSRAKEVHADGVVSKRDPQELARMLRQYL